MRKNVLIIQNRARKNGNSSVLADRVTLVETQKGAMVESSRIAEINMQSCEAFDFCQETNGLGLIQEDMQTSYPKIPQANLIVLASPIF